MIESRPADFCYVIGDCYACELLTIVKGSGTYGFYTVADCGTCHAVTVKECPFLYIGYAVRNYYA